jgi:hypothetical protein
VAGDKTDHTPPSSAEFNEQNCISATSYAFMAFTGTTLPLAVLHKPYTDTTVVMLCVQLLTYVALTIGSLSG